MLMFEIWLRLRPEKNDYPGVDLDVERRDDIECLLAARI